MTEAAKVKAQKPPAPPKQKEPAEPKPTQKLGKLLLDQGAITKDQLMIGLREQ